MLNKVPTKYDFLLENNVCKDQQSTLILHGSIYRQKKHVIVKL